MYLNRTTESLDSNGIWTVPVDESTDFKDTRLVQYFDQEGYDLTPLERLYAEVNDTRVCKMRSRTAISKPWFEENHPINNIHVNHAKLFERKGFGGDAIDQLNRHAIDNPAIYKLIRIRPKWGIDISIDYAAPDKVFEVFHYEWDDFDYDTVTQKQKDIEGLLLKVDWTYFAERVWAMRDMWKDLNFLEQSEFRTNLLGIEPERFKMVPWAFDNS